MWRDGQMGHKHKEDGQTEALVDRRTVDGWMAAKADGRRAYRWMCGPRVDG